MADKKLILLVDDDPDFVEAVRVIVENGGYEVEVAYDGQEGLEAVAERKPDLIVLDVMMPVMNGHEACAKLKGSEETADIPIILLTAVADRLRRVSRGGVGCRNIRELNWARSRGVRRMR